MSDLFFYSVMVELLAALIWALSSVIGMIADEFREGHRRVGFTMIGMIVAIVVTALPWWML